MKTRKLPRLHPGEILLHDFMKPLGLSQYGLAKAIGVTPMRLGQIVRGERRISADTALRLSRYFGTRPAWWLDLQSHYDLEQAADANESRILGEPATKCGAENRSLPMLLRETAALREWQALLDRTTLLQLLGILRSLEERAAPLRQSSPFAGLLTPAERQAILSEYESRRA